MPEADSPDGLKGEAKRQILKAAVPAGSDVITKSSTTMIEVDGEKSSDN
jgi:hypothetical protein